MRKLLLALSIAAGLTIPVTAAAAQSDTTLPSAPHDVVGAKTGTTATAAADRFREIRTHRAPNIKANIHDDWGVFTSGAAVTGQDAVQSVYSDLSISGDTLYAPTMKAPGSCVELVTTYTGGVRQVWAWDWCVSVNVAKSVDIDAGFQAHYVTSVNGHDSYRGKVEQTDAGSNTWTSYLFNYSTGQWDTFYSQSGTDQSHEGRSWNIFEIYASGDTTAEYCNALGSRTIESSSYQIKLNGAWTSANTGNTQVISNSSANDFLCPGMSRVVLNPNDDWQVHR